MVSSRSLLLRRLPKILKKTSHALQEYTGTPLGGRHWYISAFMNDDYVFATGKGFSYLGSYMLHSAYHVTYDIDRRILTAKDAILSSSSKIVCLFGVL